MKETLLYFRAAGTVARDGLLTANLAGDRPSSILVPASRFIHMQPNGSTSTLSLFFKPMKNNYHERHRNDRVDLSIVVGDMQEAMDAITAAMNSNPTDGVVVIADDTTTDFDGNFKLAESIHPSISISSITTHINSDNYGIQEYYQVLRPQPVDADDVAAALPIKIPAQSVLLAFGANVIELATNNFGAHSLQFHNAAIAVDAAGDGTEIIGAASGTNETEPSAEDIECGADGTVGQSIITDPKVFDIVDRGTDETFIHLEAQEDTKSTAMTGTPRIGVYVKWFGPPAIIL